MTSSNTLPIQSKPKKWKAWLAWGGSLALVPILIWAFGLKPGTQKIASVCPTQSEVLSDISQPSPVSNLGREVEYRRREYGAYVPRILDREIEIGGDVYKLVLSCRDQSVSPYPNQSIPCEVVLLKNGQPTREIPEQLAKVEVGLANSNTDGLTPTINNLPGSGFDRAMPIISLAHLLRGLPYITAPESAPTQTGTVSVRSEVFELKSGRVEFTYNTGRSGNSPYVELVAAVGTSPNRLVANTILCFSDIVNVDSRPAPTAYQAKGDFYYDVTIRPDFIKNPNYSVSEVEIIARSPNGQIFTSPYQRVRVTLPFTVRHAAFLGLDAAPNLDRDSGFNGQTIDPGLTKLFVEQALARTSSAFTVPSVAFDLINGRGKAYLASTSRDGFRNYNVASWSGSGQTGPIAPYIVVQPFNYYPVERPQLGPTAILDDIDRPFTLTARDGFTAYRLSRGVERLSPPDPDKQWFMYGGKWLEQDFPGSFDEVSYFPSNPLAYKVFTIAPLAANAKTPVSPLPLSWLWFLSLQLFEIISGVILIAVSRRSLKRRLA